MEGDGPRQRDMLETRGRLLYWLPEKAARAGEVSLIPARFLHEGLVGERSPTDLLGS